METQTGVILAFLSNHVDIEVKLFCFSRLAKYIVNRCFNLNEASAIPLAHVANNLFDEYPELRKLVLAHLHKV